MWTIKLGRGYKFLEKRNGAQAKKNGAQAGNKLQKTEPRRPGKRAQGKE
jgi:hypothetical protein